MRSARRRRWVALATCSLLGLVACGSDDDGADGLGSPAQVVQSSGTASATAAAPAPTPSPGPAASGPEQSVPAEDLVVLGRDGLGITAFGDAADGAVAAVSAVYGEPDTDSGWVEPLAIGACAGSEARVVSWGSLYLYFTDEGSTAGGEPSTVAAPSAAGERHLIGYSYGSVQDLEVSPGGLATPEGIGVGTTVDFLRAAYEGITFEPGEEGMFAPSFYVDERLSGRVTGADADDLVTVIIGGDPCGVGM
jgi:hypothetical protein